MQLLDHADVVIVVSWQTAVADVGDAVDKLWRTSAFSSEALSPSLQVQLAGKPMTEEFFGRHDVR